MKMMILNMTYLSNIHTIIKSANFTLKNAFVKFLNKSKKKLVDFVVSGSKHIVDKNGAILF